MAALSSGSRTGHLDGGAFQQNTRLENRAKPAALKSVWFGGALTKLLSTGLVIFGWIGFQSALADQAVKSKPSDTQKTIAVSSIRARLNPVGDHGVDEQSAAIKRLLEQTVQRSRPSSEPTDAMIREEIAALEAYVQVNPESPYTPGLRQALAEYFRGRGSYSKALEQWRAAWTLTKGYPDGPGKEIADRTLAHLARQLASLGRADELEALYREAGNRILDRGPLSVMWHHSLEALSVMRTRPEVAFRCGVLALHHVAIARTGRRVRELMELNSPAVGFSLDELQTLAQRHGLGLRAAKRERGGDIVVPSVVHWRENHYAAITEDYEEEVRVVDPTFGQSQALHKMDVSREASGYFLIPESRLPEGWRWLDSNEAAQVFGMGVNYALNSRTDSPCPSSTQADAAEQCPDCPITGQSADGDCRGCAPGMPNWWVSQPYLNLWIRDVPLIYVPNKGPQVRLELKYKQRAEPPPDHLLTQFGALWQSSWIARVGAERISETNQPNDITLYSRDGSEYAFSISAGQLESTINYFDHSRIKWAWTGSNTLGFDLILPTGQQERYRFRAGNTHVFYLSEIVDAKGHAVTLNYDAISDPIYPEIKLRTVVDADGNTFTLNYGNTTNTNLVTSVSSTVAGTVQLWYDDNVHLTDITDTSGITSSLTYGTIGWPETLVTPYGTTYFVLDDASTGMTERVPPNRYALILEPDGGQQLYAYSDEVYTEYTVADPPTPTGTPLDTFEYLGSPYRMSFHWGRTQVPLLSTLDLTQMESSDFKLAKVNHWLGYLSEHGGTPVNTLSWEVEPSPDGVLAGQSTWYDHEDKASPSIQGSEILPAVVARVMPDSTTWYTYYTRNSIGKVTQSIEKWVSGGVAQYRTNSYSYAANGIDMLQHNGATGAAETWSYNAHHQVLYHTNALGEVTSFTYNGNQQLATRTTPAGLVSTYTYNGGTAALEKIVDSASSVAVSTNLLAKYVGQNYIRPGLNGVNVTNTTTWIVTTDPRGLVVTNIYDSLGRHWERRSAGLIELTHYELFPSQSYSYSTGGKLILDKTAFVRVVGGTNFSTNSWTYDTLRRVNFEEDALGTLSLRLYCDCGSPSQITMGYGLSLAETTTNAYNLVGWKTGTWLPGLGSTSYTYDSLGRVLTVTDSLGSTTNTYDNLGRVTTVKNAFGTVESRVYDSEDRVTSRTDRNGVTTSTSYDALGRTVTRTLTDGIAERWTYSSNVMKATGYTNQIGKETLWTYDAFGRMTNEVTVGVMTNRFVYNGAGDLTDLYDGNQVGGSNRTQWRYDGYGRVTDKVYANGTTNLTYAYDLLSRATNRWSEAKGNTKYIYDKRGGLTKVDYPTSSDITLQYDALGRATNMVDAVGTTVYSYSSGLLTAEDGPWASDTVTYSHNSSRLRIQMAIAQPTGSSWTNSYSYDAGHRLTGVTSPAGAYGYQFSGAGSLVTRLDQPSGFWVTNSYDSRGRVIDTRLYDNTSALLNQHWYAMNHAHQRTTVTNFNYASTNFNRKLDYTYDNAGEVRTARAYYGGGAAVPAENLDFGYDAGWNILKRTNNATVSTYTINSLNQISADGAGSWTNDANGNLTFRPRSGGNNLSYAYDDENQLATVASTSEWKIEFSYDGRGRMRVRKDYTWSGGSWALSKERRYVYDGMLIVQERSSANNPEVTYTRGTDLSGSFEGAGGIGGLLSRGVHSGASPYGFSSAAHYYADGNGNVTMLVGTGAPTIKAYYRYDAFGWLVESGGGLAADNAMRFSSKPVMGSSELYYYGKRFYDANVQRWINRDPFDERGGGNLYAFCGNSAVAIVDAFGLEGIIGLGITPPAPGAVCDGRLNVLIDSGHTFAYLVSPSGGQTSILSFGPAGIPISPLRMSVPGSTDHHLSPPFVTWQWPISDSTYSNALSNLQTIRKSPPSYCPTNQCTTMALDFLRRAGLTNVPQGIGPVFVQAVPGVFAGYSNSVPNPHALLIQMPQGTERKSFP
jgi:RHS repeat-associated protein